MKHHLSLNHELTERYYPKAPLPCLPQGEDDLALDLPVVGIGVDRGHVLVGRLQPDPVSLLGETLEGSLPLPLQPGGYYVAVFGALGWGHDHEVPIPYQGIDHGVSLHPQGVDLLPSP